SHPAPARLRATCPPMARRETALSSSAHPSIAMAEAEPPPPASGHRRARCVIAQSGVELNPIPIWWFPRAPRAGAGRYQRLPFSLGPAEFMRFATLRAGELAQHQHTTALDAPCAVS